MTSYQQMLCILQYHRVSSFTETCVDLGVFDHLAAGPLPVSELAKLTGTHQRALHRCLRGLAHFELFTKEEESIFSLTNVSRQLTLESEFSLKPWHKLHRAITPQDAKECESLEQLLRTGKSIIQIKHNCLFYDYLREHQDIAAYFDKAMESASQMEVQDILQEFDFSASEHLTEIAGGNGALISGVLQKNENMEGQLFDFPDVVNRIEPIPRLKTVGVDMHVSLPDIQGNAMMKRILHSYSDDKAGHILENTRHTMRSGNKLYIFELIDDDKINNPYIGVKHLQMLYVHGAPGESGGPGERTQAEFASLLSTAGFELVETQQLPSIDAVVAVCK